MITNPKDFFQQVQNLVEEVALKIKAISSSLSSYLTKSDAEATYLDKTEAANTYLGKSETATRATVADSATSADKATNDANGNNISNTYLKSTTASSTYLKQTDAQSKYLGKTAKAESAKTADTATSATSAGTATKAIQDGDGSVISGTYLKSATAQSTYLSKTDASSTYLGKTAKAESAKVADSATTAVSATKATQDGNGNNIEQTYAKKTEIPTVPEVDTSNLIAKSGDRGIIAGYEQVADAEDYAVDGVLRVNQDLPDSLFCSRELEAIEFYNQDYNAISWTKVVAFARQPKVIYLSGFWGWANEQVPTIEGSGLLVAHWIAGAGGTVSYIRQYGADTSGSVPDSDLYP